MFLTLKPVHLRRQGAAPLNYNPITKLLQLIGVGGSFHLRPVAAPVAKARVSEALLQSTVVSEDQQPLAVGV